MFEKLSITSVTTSIADNAYGLWQTAKQYLTVEPGSLLQTETKNHSVKFNFKQFVLLLGTMSVVDQRASMGLGFGVLLSQIPTAEAIFPAVIDLNNLTASTGVILQGRTATDFAGEAVRRLGDVNGDGIADMLVGASQASPLGRAQAGEAYIIFGRDSNWMQPLDLNTLNMSTGVIIQGRDAGDQTGYSISGLGDVNSDGIDDLMVGAPYASPTGRSSAGKIYIIFGRNSSWPQTLDLLTLNASMGVILQGRTANDHAGGSISGLGDINNDGILDILIGAGDADPSTLQINAGEAYIVFGRNGSWPATVDLNALDVNTGVVLQGGLLDDQAGHCVSALNDINGDGIADMLVGAYGAQLLAGEAYILFGRNGSWPTTLALNTLGNAGVVLQGRVAADGAGYSVSMLDDINGDGIADMLVGAYAASPLLRLGAGEAYIIFGRSNWPQTLSLNSLSSNTGVILQGRAAGDGTGTSVSALGDVNGDGIADMLVGADQADPLGRTNAGEAYIVFGRNGSWPAVIDLNALNISVGIILQGRAAGDSASISISGLSDINGDRIADILVGASFASPPNRLNAGESYIIFGQLPEAIPIPIPMPAPSSMTTSISTPASAPMASTSFNSSTDVSVPETTASSVVPSRAPTTNSPASLPATSRSSQSLEPINFSVFAAAVPIPIVSGISTILTTAQISLSGNADPSQVVFTANGNTADVIFTVNGEETYQFTYQDLQNGFVGIALSGNYCNGLTPDVNLQANVAGSSNTQANLNLFFDVTSTYCAKANRLSTFNFLTTGISFWSTAKEKEPKEISPQTLEKIINLRS